MVFWVLGPNKYNREPCKNKTLSGPLNLMQPTTKVAMSTERLPRSDKTSQNVWESVAWHSQNSIKHKDTYCLVIVVCLSHFEGSYINLVNN